MNVKTLSVPDCNDRVLLEYIYVRPKRDRIASKTFVVNFEPQSVAECPGKYCNEFENYQEEGAYPELALRPVAMFKDPFHLGKHKIVLCVFEYFSGKKRPVFETRKDCEKVLEKVADEEPWFGFEANYFFLNNNGVPFDWQLLLEKPQLDLNNEYLNGEYVGKQRQIAESHMKACLYAGLEMYGMNREMCPSQWEYSLGPVPGVTASDQLVVSKFILVKLAEMNDMSVTFGSHKWMDGTVARQALQINFSTKKMREEGGLQHVKKAIRNITQYRQEDILKFYDLEEQGSETDYKWRLSGVAHTPAWNKFVSKVGDKDGTSIRIPAHVAKEAKGYFEERRPSGEADPYQACRVLTAAALLENYQF